MGMKDCADLGSQNITTNHFPKPPPMHVETRGQACVAEAQPKKPKLVIFDLDGTLAHAMPRANKVFIRPGWSVLRDKLLGLGVELAFWTAAERSYAKAVVKKLMQDHYDHCIILDRNNCERQLVQGEEVFLKPIAAAMQSRLVEGPADRIVLVDDNPTVLQCNPRNVIPVTTWKFGCVDAELPQLATFLADVVVTAPSVLDIDLEHWHAAASYPCNENCAIGPSS